MQDAPPLPDDFRARPSLNVEVRDVSTLLRARLALSSNWFDVTRLKITSHRGVVALHRGGRIVARSVGGHWLEVEGQRLEGRRTGFFRRLTALPVGEERVVEIERGRAGVHRSLRVTPGDARLDVVAVSSDRWPFREGCRIDLVSGVVDTEIALRCLVHFWAQLERARREAA